MGNIELLKQLREITFAPIKDCKEALMEANDNLKLAQEILKKKGISKAGNRAERETKEGIAKFVEKDGRIAGLKLSCETDFVAENENFQELFSDLVEQIAGLKKEIMKIKDIKPVIFEKMDSQVKEFMGKTGENMKIGEIILTKKKAFAYNHPGNRVATLIFFEGGDEKVAKEIALQVTAMNPKYINFDQVNQDEIDKMKEEFSAELRAAGKPETMIAQIVDGKIKKALSNEVLMEQEYIRNEAKKIKDIVPADMHISGFIRLDIGD